MSRKTDMDYHTTDMVTRLPVETHAEILRELDPVDLISFSLTCAMTFATTTRFLRYAYTHYKVLIPFLPNRSVVDEFVELMFRTGMVISGSQALSFLYRVRYYGSDLDLYVGSSRDMSAIADIVDFLVRYGYFIIQENTRHDTDHTNGRWRPFTNPISGRSFTLHADAYATSNIVRVIHLTCAQGRVIQIIVPLHNIMDCLLSFHSTVVMNMITASHAYCLYARASLVEAVNIVRRGPYWTDHVFTAIEKYTDRGFSPVDIGDSDFIIDRRDEVRRVGDRNCWSIPLSTGAKYYEHSRPPVERNTWKLVCDFEPTEPDFHFHHAAYDSDNRSDAMCVADDVLIVMDDHPPKWVNDNIENIGGSDSSSDAYSSDDEKSDDENE